MIHNTTNMLIKSISLTATEFSDIKQQIAKLNWAVLLESAKTKHPNSRWSICTAEPITTITTINGISKLQQGMCSSSVEDPLSLIETCRKKLFFQEKEIKEFPFTGGVLGYFSYELGYQFENIDKTDKTARLDLPEMAVGFYNWALLYDNQQDLYYLLTRKTKEDHESLAELWETRLNWLKEQIKSDTKNRDFKLGSDWFSNMDKAAYTEKFNKVQDYIIAGDCYQVNLAQRFQADYQGDEYQAYQALFTQNRPPFAAFIRLPEQVILSLSPERFLKLSDGVVESKPIKGTRPRFNDPVLDKQSQQALLNSEKDRSENLMIVDLLRNDIGRVCQAGTVSVPVLFAIESFPAVHHLVSTVLGKLATQYSTEDLLRVCFPGGSITGAPKIRAMEIIAELEPNQRQLYCGAIGYINSDGSMDSNITIRTLICKQQKIYCWAGGGLVADSKVDAEYQECFDKVSKILPYLSGNHSACFS